MNPSSNRLTFASAVFMAMLALSAGRAAAHCDTLDGPVVSEARQALQKGDVTPVLKWVPQADEESIRQAFRRTLAVRAKGPEARELADLYFFETLVRLHRASEGEPFSGLKPAGADFEPAIEKAEHALESDSADPLARELSAKITQGIRERHARVRESRRHAAESVEAGRRAVAAYVDYIHYVKGLDELASGQGGHHELHESHEPQAKPVAAAAHAHEPAAHEEKK